MSAGRSGTDAPTTRPEPTVEPVDPDIATLQSVLSDKQHYGNPDLTIGRLASLLSLPEYRLRNLINRELGFRNFNAFLNHYRIAEASARLSDPKQRRKPILTIALDVGYRSLSTFNKAFKEVHGMTPREFRQKSLIDS